MVADQFLCIFIKTATYVEIQIENKIFRNCYSKILLSEIGKHVLITFGYNFVFTVYCCLSGNTFKLVVLFPAYQKYYVQGKIKENASLIWSMVKYWAFPHWQWGTEDKKKKKAKKNKWWIISSLSHFTFYPLWEFVPSILMKMDVTHSQSGINVTALIICPDKVSSLGTLLSPHTSKGNCFSCLKAVNFYLFCFSFYCIVGSWFLRSLHGHQPWGAGLKLAVLVNENHS